MEPVSTVFSMDIRKFRVLRVLRDSGSINATAAILHLTPSAVSQQISTLAKEIEVQLLLPHGRGVRLTPQANILLNHVQAIDHQIELVRADLAAFDAGQIGQVVIGAFASSIPQLVTPVVARLKEERPKLVISIHEFDTPICYTHLDACDLDMVIAVHFPKRLLQSSGEYYKLNLLKDYLLIAINRKHPLAEQEKLSIKDLKEQPWILAPDTAPSREMTLAACLAEGYKPNVVHSVDDWFSVLTLVSANAGVAVIPSLAVPQGVFPDIKLYLPDGLPYRCRNVFLATRAGSEINPCITPIIQKFQEVSIELIENNLHLVEP